MMRRQTSAEAILDPDMPPRLEEEVNVDDIDYVPRTMEYASFIANHHDALVDEAVNQYSAVRAVYHTRRSIAWLEVVDSFKRRDSKEWIEYYVQKVFTVHYPKPKSNETSSDSKGNGLI